MDPTPGPDSPGPGPDPGALPAVPPAPAPTGASEVELRTPRLQLHPHASRPRAWSLVLQGGRRVGEARLAPTEDAESARVEVDLEREATGMSLEGEVARGLVAHALLDLGLARVEGRGLALAAGEARGADWTDALASAGLARVSAQDEVPARHALERAALALAARDWRRLGPPAAPSVAKGSSCLEVPFDLAACALPALCAAVVVSIADSRMGHALRDVLQPIVRLGLFPATGGSVFVITAGLVVASRHTRLGAALSRAPWPLGALAQELRGAPGPALLGLSCLWSFVILVGVPLVFVAWSVGSRPW